MVVGADAGGHVVGHDVHAGAAVDRGHGSRHRHGAGEGGSVGLEVDGPHEAPARLHLEDPGLHHVAAFPGAAAPSPASS